MVEVLEHHELCAGEALSCPARSLAVECHVVKAGEGVGGAHAGRRGRAEEEAGAPRGLEGGHGGRDGESEGGLMGAESNLVFIARRLSTALINAIASVHVETASIT